jgi:hypothetical protein
VKKNRSNNLPRRPVKVEELIKKLTDIRPRITGNKEMGNLTQAFNKNTQP